MTSESFCRGLLSVPLLMSNRHRCNKQPPSGKDSIHMRCIGTWGVLTFQTSRNFSSIQVTMDAYPSTSGHVWPNKFLRIYIFVPISNCRLKTHVMNWRCTLEYLAILLAIALRLYSADRSASSDTISSSTPPFSCRDINIDIHLAKYA